MKMRRLFVACMCVMLVLMFGKTDFALARTTNAVNLAAQTVTSSADLVQARSQNHVLGFSPNQMYLVGADQMLRIEFVHSQSGMPNVIGSESGENKAARFDTATYTQVWRGIDIVYRASAGGIAKSEYHVAPHADAAQIQLRYNVPVQVERDGSLRFAMADGRGYFTESAPVAWQEIDGKRIDVPVNFRVQGETVSFDAARYDARYALVIDPVYIWHTFYGSPCVIHGVTVDQNNDILATGECTASWQGANNANPLHAAAQGSEATVIKLGSDGSYKWHTFYGSNDSDAAWGIATDASNNIYVTGYSESPWKGNGNTNPLHAHDGAMTPDMFVLKLSANGAYQWHTFYGPITYLYSTSVVVSNSGNVDVLGSSNDSWLGDGGATPLHAHSGGGKPDIYFLQLDVNGAYQWHSFFGGSGTTDEGYSIALDSNENIYATGESTGGWFGPEYHLRHQYSGSYDLFVIKVASDGTYAWHTFYGSGSIEKGNGIAVDANDNVYVAGEAWNTWLGDGNTAPLHPYTGNNREMLVLKLNSDGYYQWHTFYGGTNMDLAFGIASDGTNVFLTGFSDAAWLGDDDTNPIHPFDGQYASHNIVTMALDGAGGYLWHTFYGADNIGWCIAIDRDKAVIMGMNGADWLGDNNAAPLHSPGDFGVLKFGHPIPPTPMKPARNATVARLRPALNWGDTPYTLHYRVEIRRASKTGKLITLTDTSVSRFKSPKLKSGERYFWRVQACNEIGCSAWSRWWRFSTK